MAGKFLTKIMDLAGLENDYNEIEESDEKENEENQSYEGTKTIAKKQSKVLSIHNNVSAKIVIIKPTSYEEAVNISDNLKNRKIVVVNTVEMDSKIAQRLLDFMGGSSYALGGELQEVEKGIYILSPSNVEVTSDMKSELTGKGLFNWNK